MPKYKIEDKIWRMNKNKPSQEKINAIYIAEKDVRYFLNSDNNSLEEKPLYWTKESELFESKEALLASL